MPEDQPPWLRSLTRRQALLAGVAAALQVSLLAACGSQPSPGAGSASSAASSAAPAAGGSEDEKYAAAKKEGKVSWYTAHFELETAQAVADAFEKKYPGVKVEFIRQTAQVVYQRLTQEQDAGLKVNDVFSSTDEGHYVVLKQKSRLMKYTPNGLDKLVPAFQNIDPDGFYHIGAVGLVLINYNSNKVKADAAPAKWQDLLDPKWKDQITIGHPGFSGFVGQWVLSMQELYGWSYMEQLNKLNPKVGRSINDTVTSLVAGERSVGAGPDATTLLSKEKGNPVDVSYPSDGTILIISPTALVKDAPHPNAAKLFFDFTYSEEYSKVLVSKFNQPLRPDVAPPKGARAVKDVKTYRPALDKIVKGVPEVIEKFRSTYGV